MADELADARARLAHLQGEATRLRAELQTVETRASTALDTAARRIEALAGQSPVVM
jgi:cell division protein ZapA